MAQVTGTVPVGFLKEEGVRGPGVACAALCFPAVPAADRVWGAWLHGARGVDTPQPSGPQPWQGATGAAVITDNKEYADVDRGHLRVTLMERSRQPFLGHRPGVPSPRLRLALKRWVKQQVDVYRPGCCFSVSGVIVN